MVALLTFAFIAGVLTVASPCVLPVVPMVLGAGSTDRSSRLVGLMTGFSATFIGATVVLVAALAAAGITTTNLRLGAAVLLGFLGSLVLLPALATRAERALAALPSVASSFIDVSQGGFRGGVLLGAAIGFIWAPSAGPIMAAVIASAAALGSTADAVTVGLAYVAGACLPLGLVAVGGQRAMCRLRPGAHRARLSRVFGGAMAKPG